MARNQLRVLVVSHGHPSLSLGGAEVASHNLHKGLNATGEAASRFLARTGHPVPRHGASALMSHGLGADEILFHADRYDHFMLSNGDTDDLRRDFVRYVRSWSPDVVHFHHFIGLGLETIYAVRDALPNAAIVTTFHEYLSICHHHGQMVKKQTGALCSRSSAIDCHQCFPEISPSRFLRRERFTRAMLDLCDHYVSPSRFLAERYVAWGLAREKMSVIENGLDISGHAPVRPLTGPEPRRSRFAFFGQMIEFKGVDILLDAVARVPEDVWGDNARVMIFGGHLERTPPEYRARLEALVAAAGPRARMYGPYRNADMPRLMRLADWVVVPSIWWENSPVVIQEAFFHGRPVIAADIGGMAEKVRDGVDGLHFHARSAEDLADRITGALSDTDLWQRLRDGIEEPMTFVDCAREHMQLYRRILDKRAPAAEPVPLGRAAALAEERIERRM